MTPSSKTSTIDVPHLGGITVGYRLSHSSSSSGGSTGPDPAKPTVVLVNSMCTTSALYDPQFSSGALLDAVNLLAVEPLGHGATVAHATDQHFTYWDSAAVALQVMDRLGVREAFALGTSQGGWIVVRMALLAPDRILGLLPLGTSMDYESPQARALGSWDPEPVLTPFYDRWSIPSSSSSSSGSDGGGAPFVPDQAWRDMVATLGFGSLSTSESLAFWDATVREVYGGEVGRKKLRMALVNLVWRDGLLHRLRDVRCPVYWLHGDEDTVFQVPLAEAHIKHFTSSKEARLTVVKGASHYLNATSPKETEEAILDMIRRFA